MRISDIDSVTLIVTKKIIWHGDQMINFCANGKGVIESHDNKAFVKSRITTAIANSLYCLLKCYLFMLVSLWVDTLVSRVDTLVSRVLLLVAVLSVEVPVVDCGGLQAPMIANTITIAKKMFFIN